MADSAKRTTMPRRRKFIGDRHIRVQVLALGIVFVAYALRVGTLTLQSLWVDEAMALHFTEGSLTATVHTIIQPTQNGPLFYFLLFWWRRVAGDSDFAVRFLSVIFSVLTLPLMFQWARRLLTDRTASLAIWLFAFSPFTLWFGQEAKMYALHMSLAVASSLMLLEAFRRGGWHRWLTYAVFTFMVLYSHLFGGFLVIAQALMAVPLGWRRWKQLGAYLLTMLLILLVHMPLLRFGLRIIQHYQPRDIWRGFVPLGVIARDALGQYFYRLPVPAISWPAFLLVAGLILSGLPLMILRHPRKASVLVLHGFAPVLIFYAVSFRVPVYTAKYLSATVPALFILAAWGIEAAARLWRPAGLLALVLGMLMTNGIVRDLTDPLMQRGDWRYVADYIDTHEGENDVVVVSAYYTVHLLNRYYQGESKVKGFTDDPYDPWAFYQRQAEKYDRLWLVLHHDQAMAPGNRLREVADMAFPVITGQFPNGGQIALIGYQLRYAYPTLPSNAQPVDACFENGMCLVGYSLDTTELAPTEKLAHPPSNWIHATLYWRRGPKVNPIRFRPLIRVVDDAFNVWGGNMDRRPDLFDRFPPDQWPTDKVIETHFDLNLNPVTPPGSYRIEISLAVDGDENHRVELVEPAAGQPSDRFLPDVMIKIVEDG